MTNEPVIVERIYNASVQKIWSALTDPAEMKKWYFDIPDFKAQPGFEFSFLAGDDQKKFLHLCRITDVIPEKKLSYTWRYDGFEGDSEVSFELFPEGDKTKLRLTHTGLENFRGEVYPQFAKKNFIGGWTYFVEEALPGYLNQ